MTNEMNIITTVFNGLINGDINVVNDDSTRIINDVTVNLLSKPNHNLDDVIVMDLIIKISNILYNNTNRDMLILEDGIYDLLISLYRKCNPNYQIGAIPIDFKEEDNIYIPKQTMINPVRFIDEDIYMNSLFMEDIDLRPRPTKLNMFRNPVYFDNNISKRKKNTAHMYPKLVGTLDKCKFVLNNQAIEYGVFEDANVEIFERDFIQKHIKAGILDPDRRFRMILELKYDGVSVEAEVSNRILSARSRGDTNNDVASDLSPILEGYPFRYAQQVPDHEAFGMKFEAIITYDNLKRLSIARGKEYMNCRNAIIGLFGSSDAVKYRDYITLVPLATSMDIGRLTEIGFINKHYHSGIYLNYVVIEGTYKEILFQVKRFLDEAEYMRDYMPFMYDGIVASYMDKDLINALGRENSVNKYSMAIKFNAMRKQATFLGYSYTIGQNGVITPMIHYTPVEFYGGIHVKSTGHSYKRFMELGLRKGDILDIVYVNDVMPYVEKADIPVNHNNSNEIIPFITHCPSCNTELIGSESGKSIMCTNINCPERNISRIVNTLQKLNVKDFSEETIRSIGIYTLMDILNITIDKVAFLGETNSIKFMDRINELKTRRIYDYEIIGALGFTSMAIEKWKLILHHIDITELIYSSDDDIISILSNIKGIGSTTINTIINERVFFDRDLEYILRMSNVITTKGQVNNSKSIRFTGIRNKELSDKLIAMGHDVRESGVTKSTDILIIPYKGFVSSKTNKVGENTIVVDINEFISNIDMYV